MRCGVCHARLQVRGHQLKEYRDRNGRVYQRIRTARYNPCPRLDDPGAHPARHYPSKYFPFGSECSWCGADLEHEPERCRNKAGEIFCRPSHKDASDRALRRLRQRVDGEEATDG